MASSPLLLTVDSQRLLIHTPDGDISIDLPFVLRPELLHKSDLAELFAEKLGERLPNTVERSGPVRIEIPLDWGSVLLDLPCDGLEDMENPLSHLEWELERNAPESAHNYLLDYQNPVGSRVRLVAVRKPVEEFLGRSFSAMGYTPVSFEVLDLKGQRWTFDPVRARTLQQAHSRESWKPVPLLAWLLPVVLVLCGGALGLGWWLGQDPVGDEPMRASGQEEGMPVPVDSLKVGEPRAGETTDALTSAASQVPSNESRPADETPVAQVATSPAMPTGSPEPTGNRERWNLLLDRLAAGESRLPAFLSVHSDGILLNGTVDLAELLTPLVLRPTQAGGEARWYSFATALDLPDAQTPRHFRLASLANLGDSLSAPVDRVMLSRRPAGGWNVAVQP